MNNQSTLTIKLQTPLAQQPNLAALMVLIAEKASKPIVDAHTYELGLEGLTAKVKKGKTIVVEVS